MLEKLGRNIGKIFLGIVAILLFLFGYQCGRDNTSKTDSKTITDTLIVHKVDTIRDTTTIVKIKTKPIIKDSFIPDTIYKDLNYVRTYENTYRDSNIVINSVDTVVGYQLAKILNYKLLVPYKIYDSTIVKITKDSLIFKPSKYELHIGLLASPKMLAPKLDISINRSTYSLGYDPFNKTPIIGYSYRLWRSKK